MKHDMKITETWAAHAGADLGSLQVECVFCDGAGEPVKRSVAPVLSLLGPRRRRVFADPQG